MPNELSSKRFVVAILYTACSLLLRRFVFRMAEVSAKRVTGDEPQGTMGRVERRLGTRQYCLFD